jgi:TetR/AcrR family transcriptional regulator, regulator of cefoperazone and chloramphenicol sensitivity
MRQRNIAAARGATDAERRSTREHLLEIAGQVFAEKGFDAATGKEICKRAGANAAAVVYHFGGLDALYAEVLLEARNRLVSTQMIAAAIAGERDPKTKLAALMGLLVGKLAGPASQSWAARVIGREILAPSTASTDLIEKEMQGRAAIMKSLVSELTGLPPEHPAVARGAISIIGPCLLLLIANRRRLERAFPALNLRQDSAEEVADHMTQFALAGLAAIARQARRAD